MHFKRNTGVYDEDHVNDYDARPYTPSRVMMEWYARMESNTTKIEVKTRVNEQSANNQNGLHFTGAGPFERELERKGIPVEKYPLTTTTGATRVREMVVLRRQQLEHKSAEAMKTARTTARRAVPSEWYDETRGPLNPKFLKAMQPHYDVAITELPRRPLDYKSWVSQKQIGSEKETSSN
ncbi:Hypothetical protein, putative [Bodo saltans]|uniref:Uncharacterized protein n=1 Tax=Bodo saltans TaxID=75058 RepID=A0A0S4JQA3_BODSA|nr:Hypothetical protein, putative [Bodo saltans]|eukprot:CUG92351.1 Hypothetical protein, putative [Bodo saltans]